MHPTSTRLYARLLRRWPLTLLGIIATCGLCVLAVMLVPVKYQAQADLLVIPPVNSAGPNTNPNPYLALSNVSDFSAGVGRQMMSGRVVNQLKHQGLDGTYTVLQDPTTIAPILIVTVNGPTAQAALNNLQLVLRTASPTVASIQSDNLVSPADAITIQTLAQPNKPKTVYKSRLRALVVAGAAGLIGTALVVSGVDELLLRRRRGRDESGADADVAAPDSADETGEISVPPKKADRARPGVVVWPDERAVATTKGNAREKAASVEAEPEAANLFVTRRAVTRADGDDVIHGGRPAASADNGSNGVRRDAQEQAAKEPKGHEEPPSTLFVVRGPAD
jgi:capsular polysaccharide biosynthesis protein